MLTLLSLLLKLSCLSPKYRRITSIITQKRSSRLIVKPERTLATSRCWYFTCTSMQLGSRSWSRFLICLVTIYRTFRPVTLAKLLKIWLLSQLAIALRYLILNACQKCLSARFLVLIDIYSALSSFSERSI